MTIFIPPGKSKDGLISLAVSCSESPVPIFRSVSLIGDPTFGKDNIFYEEF
jgi:hypothetical protein